MKTPNLFIVGQPKAGTTALQYLLDQHPEIFVLNHGSYFGKDSLKKIQKITKKEYLNKFLAAKEKKVIGDSSEQCFYSESAPREIKSFNPDSKIIILLREPLEWLRSAYQQKYRNLKENRSILEAIYSDEYLEKTKYAKYIKNYLKYFPKRNMKIILFEDFKKHNEEVLKEIFQFLGVDNEFVPPSKEIFVRNPYDRLVSAYRDKICSPGQIGVINSQKELYRDMPFKEFVKVISKISDKKIDRHFRSQTWFLTDKKGNLIPDFIGKFENFEEDYKKCMERLGFKKIPKLEHKNKSKRKPSYKEYYDEETKRFVQSRYKKDLDLFGYSF
ncbi:MAG: sulfotransferase family 2 domain-containing protein [Candidatus Paceibacteria bacterium]